MQELRNDTNIYYGQKEIEVDNVVFLTGSEDGWTPFAITKDINDNSPAYTIKSKLLFQPLLKFSVKDKECFN